MSDGQQEAEEECKAEFALAEAAKDMKLTEVESGEENEVEWFKCKCTLYRFAEATKEWKQRGKGEVKFLQSKQNSLIRVLLRQDKTFKANLNHIVPDVDLKSNMGSDKTWTWNAMDYATEDGKPAEHTFAIRLGSPEAAQDYKKKWEEARAMNKLGSREYVAPVETEGEKEKKEEEKKEAEKKEADNKKKEEPKEDK